MLENRAIPQVDPFSYTRGGEPWISPGWLVEAPMAMIHRLLGVGGLNLWTALMVTATYAFVWRTLTGGPILRAFLIVLGAAAARIYWAAGPHLVTFLLTAVYLSILEDFHRADEPEQRLRAGRHLLWLPALMVAWVNSHSGYVTGFLLLAAYLAGQVERVDLTKIGEPETLQALYRESRPLIIAGLLMVVAIYINPSGSVLAARGARMVEIEALQTHIQAWRSPDFHNLGVLPFVCLLLFGFGVVGFSRRRLAVVDFLLFAGFAFLSLMAERNIALFALAAPIVIARYAVSVLEVLRRKLGLYLKFDRPVGARQSRANYILFGLLSLAVVFNTGLAIPEDNASRLASLPGGAVEFLRNERPPGRLFNSYYWGDYLLWALPEYPVFIDGRTDLYTEEIISQWLQVVRGEAGWQKTLDSWQVRLVLLEPEMPVIAHLDANGWDLLYEDDKLMLYGR